MKKTLQCTALLLLLLIQSYQPSTAFAQGTAFTYQGRLNTAGSPANGLFDFQFALSSAPGGGSQVGSTVTKQGMGVTNGLFTTTLDFGAVFAGNPTWLAINVRTNGAGSYVGLAPLQPLLPTPYAIVASSASNLLGALPAAQLSGTLQNSALPASPNFSGTVTANAFTGGGTALTGLNPANLSAGTAGINISGNAATATTATSANSATTAGSATTATTAANVTGNVADAQLSANIARLNGANAFTGTNTFAGVTMATNVNNVIAGTFTGGGSGLTGLNPANLSAGTAGINISGNAATATSANSATTATTATTANNFSSALAGDVTGTQGATVVSSVGGQSAANVAGGANAANAATSANNANTIVKRDGSGNFSAGTITANLAGNADTATTAASANSVAAGNITGTIAPANLPNGLGGSGNTASGGDATAVGGFNNTASGSYAFAAGHDAQATNDGAFVWADTQFATFSSTNNDSFNVRAQGGARFVTSGAGLTVDGQSVLTTSSGSLGLTIQQNATSPNVILGYSGNSVSGGVVGATIGGGGAAGFINSVTDAYGTVGGGALNTAGSQAVVGGGSHNSATGLQSTIAGGYFNVANGNGTVGGGYLNNAGNFATVGGGYQNNASGFGAFIGGGGTDGSIVSGNTASGNASVVAGGLGNQATNSYATVGGGRNNVSGSPDATVAGGAGNTASSGEATVSGGNGNTASGPNATVSGGTGNTASGQNTTVSGGFGNTASTGGATVAGGYENTASGVRSFAAGTQAQATNQGAFVWADSQFGNFYSTNNDSFNVRAQGGARFVTGGTGMTVDGQNVLTTGSSIPSANLSGTLPSASLPASPTFSGAVTANSFSGNGANVTGVNAASLNGLGAANFWQTGGNGGTTPGANFIGTTDNQPLEFHVNGKRAFRLEPAINSPFQSANVIGGYSSNSVASGVVGATIAGGGYLYNDGVGDIFSYPNQVLANFGTVGGGNNNTASGQHATVAGGQDNIASGGYATVAGGFGNTASGGIATVVGGYHSTASGSLSFAAGNQAQATNDGAFVWADSQSANFYSTNNDSFNVRAQGGARFVTGGKGMSVDGPVTVTGGSVGIGTTTPAAGLDVESSPTGVNHGTWGYLQQPGYTAGPFGGSPNLAIYTSGAMGASTYYAFSDARIKNIIGVSAGAKDLKTLQAIEVTDYTYKDTVANGSRQVKKVIAQQVESVYPQAVSQTTGVVPDIFQAAAQQDGWVKLATNLKVGERVKLISENGQGIYPVLETRGGAFRTDFKPATEKVFVYGREVNDFRNVDYEALTTLNVSATQELARKLDAQQAALAKLQVTLTQTLAEKKTLLKHLAALEARDQEREDRLARIERDLEKGSVPAKYAALNFH